VQKQRVERCRRKEGKREEMEKQEVFILQHFRPLS